MPLVHLVITLALVEFFLFGVAVSRARAGHDRQRSVRALFPGADEYARAADHFRAVGAAVRALPERVRGGGARRRVPHRAGAVFPGLRQGAAGAPRPGLPLRRGARPAARWG